MSGCITVILSSFNRPEGLRKSFESVDRQTARDRLDIIVCDDGSPNGEVHLLLDRYEKLPGVRVIRGEPRPVEHKKIYCTFTELINRAMDVAGGKYFSYLTDGNEYTPGRCENYAAELDGRPDVFLVWGMVQNIRDGKVVPMQPFGRLNGAYIRHHLPRNNFIDHSSVMHRKTDVRWDTDPHSWRVADWLYWRRLLEANLEFDNLPFHGEFFHDDKDGLGRCLMEEKVSFEEMMERKLAGSDGTAPEVPEEERIMKRVKYAKNVGIPDRKGETHPKIEIVDGEEIHPGDLVLLEKVMTSRGNLFPAFTPFGEVGEYTPKKPVQPAGPKVPFAGMAATVEAARKRAEEMAVDDKSEKPVEDTTSPAKKKTGKKKTDKKKTAKKSNRKLARKSVSKKSAKKAAGRSRKK